MNPNPSIVFLVIGAVFAVAAIGFGAEALICKKLFRARFVLPAGAALLYIVCGLVTETFESDGASFFKVIMSGSVCALALFGRKKNKTGGD